MPIHKHLRQRPVLETTSLLSSSALLATTRTCTTSAEDKASFYRILPEISTATSTATATTTNTTGEPPLVYCSVSPTSSTTTTTTTTTTGTISPTSESSSSTASSLQVMAPDAAGITTCTLDPQHSNHQQQQQQQQAMTFSALQITNPTAHVASTTSFANAAAAAAAASSSTNGATAATAAVAPQVLDPLQMLANLATVEGEHKRSVPPAFEPSSSSAVAATTTTTVMATAPAPMPSVVVEESSSSSWAVGKESLYNSEFYNPTMTTMTTTEATTTEATSAASAYASAIPTIREVSNASSISLIQQMPQREDSWSIVPPPPPPLPPPPLPPPPRRERQHPLLESSPSFYEEQDEHQQPIFLPTFSSQGSKGSPRKTKPKKAKTAAVRTKRLPPKKKKTTAVRKNPKLSKAAPSARAAAAAAATTTTTERSSKPAARESLPNERSIKSLLLQDDSALSKKTNASESLQKDNSAITKESVRIRGEDSLLSKNPESERIRGQPPSAAAAKAASATLRDGDSLPEKLTGETLSREQQRRVSPINDTKDTFAKQSSSLEKTDSVVSEMKQDEHKRIEAAKDSQGSLVAVATAVAASSSNNNNNNSNKKEPKTEKRAVESSSRNANATFVQPHAKPEEEASGLPSEDHDESVPSNQQKKTSIPAAALEKNIPSKTESMSARKESPKSFKRQPKSEMKRDSPKDNAKQTKSKTTVSKKNRTDKTFVMPVTERQAVLSRKKMGVSTSCSSSSSSRRRNMEKPRYATGTEFRRFFERGNHWYAGVIVKTNIVESENAGASWQYEMLFDDHLQMSFHERDDAEELDKMLRLALIRPHSRVAIFWPADNTFYKATILREEESRRRGFYIRYDDGEDEWINLWRHEFQVLDDVTHQPSLRRQTRQSSGVATASQDVVTRKRRASDSAVSQQDDADNEEPVSKRRKVEASRDTGRANRKGNKTKSSNHYAEDPETENCDEDDDNNDDDCVIEQPPRRKRGRPPKKTNEKNATVAKGKTGDENKHDVSDLEDTDVESLDQSPPPPSRKRGRPPKKARSKDSHDVSDLEDTDDESSKPSQPPRKRGRPPKKSSFKGKGEKLDDLKKTKNENKVLKGDQRPSTKNQDNDKTTKNPGSASGRKPKWVVEKESDSEVSDEASLKSIEFDSSDDERAIALPDKKSVGIEVGYRVSVYWPGEEKFFKATVTKERNGKRRFYLEYDDGDEEWVDFTKERYRILSRTPAKTVAKEKSSTPPTRRHSRVSSPPSARKGEVDVSRIRLNTRVAVWWPDDRRYYKATVTRIQPEANWRPYFLEYDDGDEEWIDLRQHKVRILAGAAEDESAFFDKKGLCRDLSRVWIGSRLAIWWPAEEEFFYCTVTRHRDHKRCFYLEYDDGDREWIDLNEHKFYIVKNESAKKGKKSRQH